MSGQQTVFEALTERLRKAAEFNSEDPIAPAVILWTDKEEQWQPLLPRLREALPELLTLGAYDLAAKTGPAIWLRCMIARKLPEADWAENMVPIIYLPGVSRQELRAVEECPRPLQPLAELQYRGVLFTQLNARDWTAMAFLVSEDGGLALEVAQDNATKGALRRALIPLADQPVAGLRGRRLQAADFDELLNPDQISALLRWLNDPAGVRSACEADAWGAFRSGCRERFGFDPETDGALVGAEKLGGQAGNWQTAWHRFAESPRSYHDLLTLLRQARPANANDLFFNRSAWPQDNEAMEAELREALSALADRPAPEARGAIARLEQTHRERRGWVWAQLGEARLAQAVEPLATLARVTERALGGVTPQEIVEQHASGLWQADGAALDALAVVEEPQDVAAVTAAVRATYRPWLEAGAEHCQQAVKRYGLPGPPTPATSPPQPGTCLLFADGLRFDVGQKLKAKLVERGLAVGGAWAIAAFPSVTAAAKPAASPAAGLLIGGDAGTDFAPSTADGKPLTTERFRALLSECGCAVLSADEVRSPDGVAWAECGALDRRGHEEGAKLAHRIEEELRGIERRVAALLAAGWAEVKIVTDHGWLLLPGGLGKTELPAYLAETRWGRCAALKSTSQVGALTVPWHWNPNVLVAAAPGYVAGKEYGHGGLTVQECVVPVLTVTAGASAKATATIDAIRWVGLRCHVTISGPAGLMVDPRVKAGDPSSSAVAEGQPKAVGEDGQASLMVTDDSLEGTAVHLVVLDASGDQIAKEPTTIGG